jgi:hypothetical protein
MSQSSWQHVILIWWYISIGSHATTPQILSHCHYKLKSINVNSGVPRNYFSGGVTPRFFLGGGGVQQIQLRIEGRENGNRGAVAP